MAVCLQKPECCFLPSVSLETFGGIEMVGTSLESRNCSPVLAWGLVQRWFWWAGAQVFGTYRQAVFIGVEVYSNRLKYLQNCAALSLLALCSCCLKPSVKSGSLLFPPPIFSPCFPQNSIEIFAPLIKTEVWGEGGLCIKKSVTVYYWINNLMWILLLYFLCSIFGLVCISQQLANSFFLFLCNWRTHKYLCEFLHPEFLFFARD